MRRNRVSSFLWRLGLSYMAGLIFVLPHSAAQGGPDLHKSCLAQFSSCARSGSVPSKAVLQAVCAKRRKELHCDSLRETATAEDQKKFFDCDKGSDVCDQLYKQSASLLYSCGGAVGGVLVDSVLGFVMLPKTLWDLSQRVQDVPETYKSCSSDFQSKLLLLGTLRPKDMTDESIQRMSCGEIRKFIESKVTTILDRLQSRRLQLATTSGNENVTVYDLKLSEQEIQALNYDQNHPGPLRRALCFKPEEGAKTACALLTQGAMTVTGAAAAASSVKLVRVFAAKRSAKLANLVEAPTPPKSTSGLERAVRPKKISPEFLREKMAANQRKVDFHIQKTERALNDLGVNYQKLPKQVVTKNGKVVEAQTNYQMDTPLLDTPASDMLPNGGGELYYIRSVKRGKSTSGTDPALTHADMPELLKEINENGYGVVVDSTLTFPEETTIGRHVHEHRMLLISPETSWAVLQHEFQHALFSRHITENFKSLRMKVQNGENLKDLLSQKAQKDFSGAQIKEMEKLMKAGVDMTSVNERVATMREMKVLGWKKVTTDGIIAEKYGLEFTQEYLNQLAQKQALTPIQQKTLGEVNSRIKTLTTRGKILNSPVTPVAGAGGAAAVFGSAMYLNKDGSIVFRDPETKKWVLLKGK